MTLRLQTLRRDHLGQPEGSVGLCGATHRDPTRPDAYVPFTMPTGNGYLWVVCGLTSSWTLPVRAAEPLPRNEFMQIILCSLRRSASGKRPWRDWDASPVSEWRMRSLNLRSRAADLPSPSQ